MFRIQEHFIASLQAGKEPETSGADNVKTLALVEAAYCSASQAMPVDPRRLPCAQAGAVSIRPELPYPRLLAIHHASARRDGRAAEGGGLLNRYTVKQPYRGFESPSLRHFFATALHAVPPCPALRQALPP